MKTITEFLRAHLSPGRFKHTLGTVQVAGELARLYGVSPRKAEMAALLHDAGKGMPSDAMIRYVRTHHVSVPLRKAVCLHSPALLHSYISAHIARVHFNITDPDILHAITTHTLGAVAMSRLAKIMYVADFISPDRRYAGCKHIRLLAYRDLDAAVHAVMSHKFYTVIQQKKWLHPHAATVWNAYLSFTP